MRHNEKVPEMKVETRPDRVNAEVPAGTLRVIHSVQLDGFPLRKRLIVDYLRANGPQTTVKISYPNQGERGAKSWDLAAIANGDFSSGTLDGFREFAMKVIDEDKPVIELRRIITAHAANMLEPQAPPVRDSKVVHSAIGTADNHSRRH